MLALHTHQNNHGTKTLKLFRKAIYINLLLMFFIDFLKALHVNEMCQPNLNIAKYYQTKFRIWLHYLMA